MRKYPLSKEYRRAYYAKHKERYREAYAKVRETKEHKARITFHYALSRGEVIKPEHCEKCDSTNIEAHHPDYDKPLEVIWLCRQHHVEEHKK
jgi:hypothetical protein